MKFRTELEHPRSDLRFGYNDRILTLGSCFSEEIAKRMNDERFRVNKNPFGTIYNPLGIELISEAITGKKLNKIEEASIENGGKWVNFYLHSSINGNSKEEIQKTISERLRKTHSELVSGSVIILTLGTSKVFWRNESEDWVGNCHKRPSREFSESFLSVKDIVDSISNSISNLRSIQQDLKFILTVSPVRHMRMGMIENQRSKARLILACEELIRSEKNTSYFPSYEILMDDLRDYRFYGKDLIHPSEEAIDYIWEKFKKSHLEDGENELNEQIKQIVQGLQHRPFDPASKEHRSFLTALLNKAERLNYSDLLSEDIKEIKNRLG